MMKKWLALTILLTVVGCAQKGTTEQNDKQGHYQILTYQCAAIPLIVTVDKRDNKINLLIEGQLRELRQVKAASGVKYEKKPYVFWSHDHTATVLKQETVLLSDCLLTQ